MNKLIISGLIVFLTACGGANDGDAGTDTTTTLPPDTSEIMNAGVDTAGNINTNTGTYNSDTSGQNKTDVRSSGSAYPDGRGVKANKKDSVQ